MIDFFEDLWSDGWIGRTLAVICAVVCLALLAICSYGIFCASDSWYVEDRDGTAVVTSHCYRAPYTSLVPVGKILVPQYHPARWSLEMEVAGGTDDFTVTPSQYERIPNGELIRVRYRKGRFSDWIYIKEAWL